MDCQIVSGRKEGKNFQKKKRTLFVSPPLSLYWITVRQWRRRRTRTNDEVIMSELEPAPPIITSHPSRSNKPPPKKGEREREKSVGSSATAMTSRIDPLSGCTKWEFLSPLASKCLQRDINPSQQFTSARSSSNFQMSRAFFFWIARLQAVKSPYIAVTYEDYYLFLFFFLGTFFFSPHFKWRNARLSFSQLRWLNPFCSLELDDDFFFL